MLLFLTLSVHWLISLCDYPARAAAIIEQPTLFTASWVREVGLGSESNLLQGVRREQLTVTWDLNDHKLCAEQVERQGDKAIFVAAEALPQAQLILPEAGVVAPFHLAAVHDLLNDLPFVGLHEAAWYAHPALTKTAIVESTRQGGLQVSAHRGDGGHLIYLKQDGAPLRAEAEHGLARRQVLYSAPPLSGRLPLVPDITVLDSSPSQRAFFRFLLVRYSSDAATVKAALAQCRSELDVRLAQPTHAARQLPGSLTRPPLSPQLLAQSPASANGRYLASASLPVLTVGLHGAPPSGLWQQLWRAFATFHGPHCPHYPTCSQYCALAIRRHGLGAGSLLTAQRLINEAGDLEASGAYRLALVYGRWRVLDPVP